MINNLPEISIDRAEYEKRNIIGKINLFWRTIVASTDSLTFIAIFQSFLNLALTFNDNYIKNKFLNIVLKIAMRTIMFITWVNVFRNYIERSLKSSSASRVDWERASYLFYKNNQNYDHKKAIDGDYDENEFPVSRIEWNGNESLLESLFNNQNPPWEDNVKIIEIVDFKNSSNILSDNKIICHLEVNTEECGVINYALVLSKYGANEKDPKRRTVITYHNGFVNLEDGDNENILQKYLRNRHLKTLDVKNNYVYINSVGELVPKPKNVESIKVFQLNVDKIKESIKRTFENNSKRCLALIGKYGTGKTITIKKIVSLFPENVCFIVSPENLNNSVGIENLFEIISEYKNCFVVFDDFDGAEVSKKSTNVSTLLSKLDNNNNSLSAFIFLSVNNPKLVDPSIIGRQERVDEILKLNPPTSNEEIMYLLEYQSKKLNITIEDINDEDLLKIVDNRLTHVQITAIVTYSFTYYGKITKKSFHEAIEAIKTTEKFSKENPLED